MSVSTMNAAVIHSFDAPPVYESHPSPTAEAGEEVVEMRAASASQLARAVASGKHYSSPKKPPMIPGVDGVGTLTDGRRVYFAFPRAPFGTMADRSVVSSKLCVELPGNVDDTTAAAIANPGMSSWAALTERARLLKGEVVLVNGATGVSGRLAVRIARHLGARKVIATGRNSEVLASLDADVTVALTQSPEALVEAFREQMAGSVDVVLDYLWGPSAGAILAACAGHGSRQAEPRVRFVQIGSMGGGELLVPAGVLRSSGLELMGSGIGSVSMERLVVRIGELLKAVVPAGLTVDYETAPLSDVADAWTATSDKRLVLTM